MDFDTGVVIFFIVFAIGAGAVLFRFFRFGSLQGAVFGAPVVNTVGEVSGAGYRTVTITVHRLGGEPEIAVGLTVMANRVNMIPLSTSEATKLIALLQAAVYGG